MVDIERSDQILRAATLLFYFFITVSVCRILIWWWKRQDSEKKPRFDFQDFSIKKAIRIVSSFLMSWYVLSFLALLPSQLSLPVPIRRETQSDSYYQRDLEYFDKKTDLAAGTPTSKGFYKSSSLWFGYYYDSESGLLYIPTKTGTISYNPKTETETVLSSGTSYTLVPCEKYYVASRKLSDLGLYMDGTYYEYTNWERLVADRSTGLMPKDAPVNNLGIATFAYELERAKAAPHELAILLHLMCRGRIMGYDPQEEIFTACSSDDTYYYPERYLFGRLEREYGSRVNYPSIKEVGNPILKDSFVFLNTHEWVHRDPETNTLYRTDFITGERTVLAEGVDSVWSLQQRTLPDGRQLIACFLPDGSLFYSWGTRESSHILYPNDTEYGSVLMTDQELVLVKPVDAGYQYYVIPLDELEG